MFFVYILRLKNNLLYIGHTDDLARREREHNFLAHGAKFVKDNGRECDLVYHEEHATRPAAMKREKQIKRWTRAKKEALIAQDNELLKRL